LPLTHHSLCKSYNSRPEFCKKVHFQIPPYKKRDKTPLFAPSK
jgi:hypothetical protein